MNVQAQQNPDRFRGLAAIYNATRPACPQLAVDLICRYLNIRQSGHFRFTREIVFSSIETCDATRFIGIFLSQGGVQAILRQEPELLTAALAEFESLVQAEFADTRQEVVFCYRMRLGVK